LIYGLLFLAGVMLCQQLPVLPHVLWGIALIPPLFFISRHRWLRWPLVVACGLWWALFRATLVLDQVLPHYLEGKDVLVIGRVADLPQPNEFGVRFPFLVSEAWYGRQTVPIPAKIQLSYRGKSGLPQGGEVWRLVVRLRPPHGFMNPGGFDYEAHLFEKRIRASGYVRHGKRLATADGTLTGLRQRLGVGLTTALGDGPAKGIIPALVTGDRGGIDASTWRLLGETGTGHLVAISGLHVGLVAAATFFLTAGLWRWTGLVRSQWPVARVAAVAAFIAAAGYSALAGFSLPTQRALIMLAVWLAGIGFGRSWPGVTVLGTALLAVLVWDPLSVLSAGFWLSFGAVAAIGLGMLARRDATGPSSQGVADRFRALSSRARALMRVQWLLAVALLPLTLLFFQQVALISPLANAIAVPVFSLIVVPFALLAALLTLTPFDAAVSLALVPPESVINHGWPVLEWLRATAPAWRGASPGPLAMVLGLAGIVWLLSPAGVPSRWTGVLLLLPAIGVAPRGPAPGEVRLALLDVGQGLAAVVRTANHVMVFDTGPAFSPGFDAGAAVVVPYLRQGGVTGLDLLVLSHGDNDHIGGMQSVLRMLPVKRVLSSVPGILPDAERCRAGQTWDWDQVHFEMLSPLTPMAQSDNNGSCVLSIRSAYGRLLFPADIERKGEAALVNAAKSRIRADILIAPHHGSQTSSSEAFLAAARPALVLIPAGYGNRYGHPHALVVRRYVERGSRVVSTASSGAIELDAGNSGIRVTRFRERARRYWHHRVNSQL
jgi:competence protein ComEC